MLKPLLGVALVTALTACSRREPAPPRPVTPVVSRDVPRATVVDVAPAPPRAPVVPLTEALQARRPRHEIVPQSCQDHLCLLDGDDGPVRATRSILGAAPSARRGHEVIFARGREMGFVESRYSGGIWRWNLARDEITALNEKSYAETYEVAVYGTPFGVIITADEAATEAPVSSYFHYEGRALKADGEGITLPERSLGELYTIRGTVIELHRIGFCGFSIIRREGDALVRDEVPNPRGCPEGGTEHSQVSGDQGFYALLKLTGTSGVLEYARLPSREIREVTFDDLGERVTFEDRADALYLVGAEAARRVDLETGAVSRVAVGEVPARPTSPATTFTDVRPLRALVHAFDNDGLWLLGLRDMTRLGADGVRRTGPHEFPLPDAGSPCACVERALVCGERRVEDACMTVRDLAPLWRGERPNRRPVTTLTTPDGRFRLDGADLDILRVTRLRDGARIWVRGVNDGVLAQADDGAWMSTREGLSHACVIRWGTSLETSPITRLDAHGAALERPTLVADFFSDRPLPTADLSQTPAR